MINENGTSFCKRIDENSAINYLWRNTVKKAQLGNDYMAKKKKKMFFLQSPEWRQRIKNK